MSSAFCTPDAKRSRLAHSASSQSPGLTPRSKALLQVPPSPCLKKLGYGTGVNVFLYNRPGSRSSDSAPSPWAIKKLSRGRDPKGEGAIAKRLEKEAELLKSMKHPNIIGFRGYRRNSDGSRLLAVENGEKALMDMIDGMRDEDDEYGPFDAEDIEKVIRGVAGGLKYLHEEKKLLHGDIKSGNILVIGDFEEVKLCDFGVCVRLDENLDALNPQEFVGTGPWTAKEASEEDVVSDKTDIFALGCVIYEMLALETPHISLLGTLDDSNDDPDASIDDEAYEDALGTRPDLPEDLDQLDKDYQKVLGIFYACTEEDPAKRPSAKAILESLDA